MTKWENQRGEHGEGSGIIAQGNKGREESFYFAIFFKLVVYVVLDLSFVYITFVVLIDMMSSLLPFSSLIYVGFLWN